jgi:hypothetical protein
MKRLIDTIEERRRDFKKKLTEPDALLISEKYLKKLIKEFSEEADIEEEAVKYTFEVLGYDGLKVVVADSIDTFKLAKF